MRREELFMDILGGLDEKYVALAMPRSCGHSTTDDTHTATAIESVELDGKITTKDRILYWVTHSLGVAAAAFLIIGAAVLLIMNWDKIAVSGNDRPGVITTVSEPVVTSDSTITEPDKYDPFLYYSDMDMPEPFAQPEITEFYYGGTDGWHDEFYNLWKNDFYMIDDYLQKYVGEERAMEVISGYKAEQLADNQAGNITRYRIDDTQNWYRFAMDTGLTANDVRRARQMADENWSESPASMVQEDIFVTFGSKEKIAENNKTEYCISVGEYVFSPRWLYYHTTEDYKAAGITPRMINDMLEKYKTLGLTDEAWAAFSAKLQEYADTADPFGQITDTSMPRPFPEWHDTDNAQFEFQWKTKAVGAAMDCRGRENYDEWDRRCMSIRTPYRLDDNNNVAGGIKWFGITSKEIDEYFEKRNARWQESLEQAEERGNEGAIINCRNEIFSEEEINALKSGNDAEIIALFISDYSIWLTGSNYVISPEWLYYHTAEDYAAIGIEPQMIAAKIPLFEKTFTGTDNGEDLDEKSWKLFKAKLTAYAESAEITDRLSVKTDSMPVPFKPTESLWGLSDFYLMWQDKFGGDNTASYIDLGHFFPASSDIAFDIAETPYNIENSYNDLRYAELLGLSNDELGELIRKRNEIYSNNEGDMTYLDKFLYTDENIEVLLSGNRGLIAHYFLSDLAIAVGENVFSPQWLYYHTIDDYETAGIDPFIVRKALPMYEKTFAGEGAAMYTNAWAAFKQKLINYAYRETYTFSLAEIGSGFDTELFERSFYGKWEKDGGSSDDNGILLTYRDDMFTFENWIHPRGIAETDELYVMPYTNCGVGECYIIKKDAPDVLYKGWWNLASYGGGSDEKDVFIINSVHDKYILADRYENDRELIPGGEIGVWGLYKLIGNSAQSAIFSQFCLETGFEKTGGFNGSGSFTDENGVVWEIAGTKSMPLMKIYYIGGDGSHDLRLAVRYYEKTEFDSFAERNYTFPEPTEHYFILSFETEISDGGTVCNITRSAYSLPEQDSVEVIVDDGIEEPGPSDEVTIMEDDEF